MDVAATVASQDVTYPLFVDPDWSTGQSASWYTDKKYPTTSYLSTGAGYVLRAGVDSGGGWYSNAFFQFPIPALRGKQILGATMGGRLDYQTDISRIACHWLLFPTQPLTRTSTTGFSCPQPAVSYA